VQGTTSSSAQPAIYCLDLAQGDWTSIRVFSFNNSMDPVLNMISPPVGNISGGWSNHDDEDGDHRNSFVAFQATPTGTYELRISPYSAGGAFRMAIDRGRKAGSADVNTDCAVNSLDYSLILPRLGGSDRLGDVNVDGIVNSIDAVLTQGWLGRMCR